MTSTFIAFAAAIGFTTLIVIILISWMLKWYVKVDQGTAMIINKIKPEPEVTFTGGLVIPVVHRKEIMEISLKTIEIVRKGKDGLICKDNIRADIIVAFFVRVNKTKQDVLKVAQAIGCARASDPDTLEELFNAKFSEALKTVGKQLDFEDLYRERDNFRDKIIEVIGNDLNGYVLEDAAIDYLEQTPLTQLDASNILDAQGIRKITELTSAQHILTNEFERNEETQIKKRDVEAKEAILELERQQKDAEARQAREVATVFAREKAEQEKIEAEERLKAEQAGILTQQELSVQEENMQREVQIAQKGRERAVVIEEEKVNRARELERIEREKEVALQEISKERAVEEEKREIAEVVRQRIAVDKTVAEEEENIKELRVVSDADRQKQVRIISAEAEAQEALVKDIKAAEAAEQTSHHKAKERLVQAEAELDASAKEAEAKKRLAEGTEAELAAAGLAEARVIEATALAEEKRGHAEAIVLKEKMQAEAEGRELQGMAEVRIKDADADGEERQAMVQVKVKTANAEAIAKEGQASAAVIREKLKAEADGLVEKFKAMDAMSDTARNHEEYRMKLDKSHEQIMTDIEANKHIASEQAEILGIALKDANIDIIGGNGDFFDKFVNSIAVGKSLDGVVDRSKVVNTVFKDHLNGDRNLIDDVKDMVGGNLGTEDLKNLSVSAFINQVMKNGTDEHKKAISSLLSYAESQK